MYWGGYQNGCCNGYNDSGSWIWIIIIIFVLFFICRDNNRDCHH